MAFFVGPTTKGSMEHKLKSFAQSIASALAGAWALIGDPYQVLFILIFLDLFMGMYAAFVRKELTSRKALTGILFTKVSYVSVIVVAALVAPFVPQIGLELRGVIYSPPEIAAIMFSIVEALSILENAGQAGVPLPGFLIAALEKVREDIKAAGEDENEDERE